MARPFSAAVSRETSLFPDFRAEARKKEAKELQRLRQVDIIKV